MEKLLAALAQTHGFDDDDPVVSTPSEVGFVSSPVIRKETEVERLPTSSFSAAERVIGYGEKRKRGRPPKGQIAAKPPPPKRKKTEEEEEEEDVCFICFDGGSLVLCDRKGCPKAYHPACIKRDEEFFNTKSKWICGWHICRVCQKSSYYMCYTCTYSLCKGCTKDEDYLCVRGNKGFCSMCMKTIMLIENKDQATNESVQVDFDDQTSFEYLFKMYWVLLKDKLSLTFNELMQATKPWNGATAVARKAQCSSVLHSAVGVSNSCRSTGHLELNKPHLEDNLTQNDRSRASISSYCDHVEELNNDKGKLVPSFNKDNLKSNVNKVSEDTCSGKATDWPDINEAAKESCIATDQDDSSTVKHTSKPCSFSDTIDNESNKPHIDRGQWASKELLEFVGYMKHGDMSPISQFDVQTLLLEYIKRNNLRDPRRKSQIICDPRLKKLFIKPRVGHIEMLKLLEFHFLIKEDSKKNSVIPAGFVSSVATDVKVDRNSNELPKPINSRKRKTRRKTEAKTLQHDLNEYAAIDVHNISLIYLRRNLMEKLLNDHESFKNKVIGSIVRIRISSHDQKPEVFRLVQVVGTSYAVDTYKLGDKTTNVMLEVLNLDRKEVVSIDAISNLEFTEDDCKRLRQIIRCRLVKPLTIGEVQMKALALQSVRVNDWLEAEVLRLNCLRDRASEKGHKKEIRECVARLELLKSPEERHRRISEVPEIHADPKMNPNYDSEKDTRIGDNRRIDEHAGSCNAPFPPHGRKSISPYKKGKDDRYNEALNRILEKTDESGSCGLDKHSKQINVNSSATGSGNDESIQRSGLETSTATASLGNSPCADNLETEKLWHYRDPNGKIQGPFSMMQLRKWNTTGLFLPDMRIWTNHEQFDSLLLSDALNGKLYGASELLCKPASGSNENMATGEITVSESTNRTNRDQKQTEGPGSNSLSVSSDKNTGHVRADDPVASEEPQCWDLLKDSNPSANDVIAQKLLPPSSGKEGATLTDCGKESGAFNHGSQNTQTNSTGLTCNPMNSEHEHQIQSRNEDRAGQPSEEDLRFIKVDLSSNDMDMDSGPVFQPVLESLDSSKRVENADLGTPNPTPTTGNRQPLFVDVPLHDSGVLELLSPTPRSNNEFLEGQAAETKQSGFSLFPNSEPDWSGASYLPEVDNQWCGYSPTPATQSIQEWDSGLVTASSSKPPEVMSEYIDTSVSDSQQLANASTSQPASTMPSWLSILNEPIEFDALGEESVSDLLAEVDAMESRGVLASPTSALKFVRELFEDCKDDCFSSIEEFSPAPAPIKSDAFSSTSDLQSTSQSLAQFKPTPYEPMDSFTRSSVHSSVSSEGETIAPTVHSGDAGSECHPSTPNYLGQELVGATTTPGHGLDPTGGSVQGNINLVTVQGNVNLVLVGSGQGMSNIGWGTNQGTAWANQNASRSPRNASLTWDGQRKYGGERFSSPRERGYQGGDSEFGRGRAPWGRQQYSGGGYTRPFSKSQRVCKFYESGHCKKGAFCDYLHP